MKDFALVLKILLKNNFRAGKNKYIQFKDEKSLKKQKTMKIVNVAMIVLGFSVLFAVAYLIVHVLSMVVAVEGLSASFLSTLLTAGQIMIIFFGLSAVLSNTFFARDNEFLASLPVKPQTVFAVKMTVIYLNELVVSTILMTPILIAFITGSIVGGTNIPTHFYFMIPVILLTQPIVPLVLISLFSFPLIKVVGYFKNKSVVTLVLSVFAFAAFMGLYMTLVPNIEKFVTIEGQTTLLTGPLKNIIIGMGKVVFYNSAFASALTGTRFWINILIFIATVAVATGLSVGFAAALYGKAAGKSGEETRRTSNVTIGTDIASGKKALFVREWKTLIRNQSFAFNSILGSIVTPIIILVMDLIGVGGTTVAAADNSVLSPFAVSFSNTGFIIFYCLMLMCGTNYAATLAFSREGNTFYVLRYLPVDLKDIVEAKANLANLISFVGLVLTAMVALIFTKIGFLNALPLVIVMAVYLYAFNELGVYRDLKKPNVNWTSAYEVIKKNLYPMIPMFFAMGIGIVMVILSQIIAKYENAVKLAVTVPIFWVVALSVGIAIIIAVKFKLKKNLHVFFDRINFDV